MAALDFASLAHHISWGDALDRPTNAWLWPHLRHRYKYVILGIKNSIESDSSLVDTFSKKYVGIADKRNFKKIHAKFSSEKYYDTCMLIRDF
jgi:hypothetical protein